MVNNIQSALLQTWEQHIHAFVELCPAPFSSHSKADNPASKDLTDIAVGVKDIIDVKGLPTRNGSETCRTADAAAVDATVVASLRSAGARIIGKTTTTEYAYTDPTNCRNPYDVSRSPGGSSSGSGAAVAAGIVDMALGTQTAGSLCRPAAYCGVIGFKPTYGVLPTTGVTPLASTFDTVGIIARSIDITRRCFSVMTQSEPLPIKGEPDVARVLLPTQIAASDETINTFHDAAKSLEQRGTRVKSLNIKTKVNDIVTAHRTVMNAELAQAHKHLLHPEQLARLRPKFKAGLEAGTTVSATKLEQAHGLLSSAREDFWLQLSGIDIVLTLAVPDAAPMMDGTTGFQDWLTPWTVFGGPLVCLPWGLDSLGRPKSIMLAAPPGRDMQLLAMAQAVEQIAPTLAPPTPPGTR